MAVRKRLYADGLWIARRACDAGDPSLNWIDLRALALEAGCLTSPNACYFGICDPEDPTSERPMQALAQALARQGVSCSIRREPAPPTECTRCGHGWEHYPANLLSVDLALTVAEHASAGEIDEAVVICEDHTANQLREFMARRHPSKQVTQLHPTTAQLRAASLSQAVPLSEGTVLVRPGCWAPPQLTRVRRHLSLVDRG